MTVDEALTKFILQLKADGRSSHTVGQYERHIRLFSQWLAAERGTDQLDGLDHESVATFLNAPMARLTRERVVKRPNTVNALRTSLRCLFAFAHAAGWIRTNPARLVRRALCSPGPPRAMSDDEVDRLLATLAAANDPAARRDHVLFHLLLGSGLRIGSALGLDIEDVDVDHGEVRLRRMKGGCEDTAPLGQRVRDHLREFIGTRTSGPLFRSRGDMRLCRRHAQRRFASWLKKAGISRRFSPHALRHTCATRVYNRTRDVLLVKEVLRHRSITSSMNYTRPDEDRIRAAIA